jgi:predicted ArsR family transcriptional regulator
MLSDRHAGVSREDRTVSDDGFAERVSRVSALADPIRRALYHFVAHQPGAVSRDQAAAGLDIPRYTAKFHLDKLVEEGLLAPEFRRLSGRSGPGAGRPAKLYRRVRKEVNVTLPRRRYDLAGHVLADTLSRVKAGAPVDQALQDAADNAANIVVESWPPEEAADIDRLAAILSHLGYEPRRDGSPLEGGMRLSNCPFQQLSDDHTDLVCPLNRQFIDAVGRRLECTDAEAISVERRTGCCVALRPTP